MKIIQLRKYSTQETFREVVFLGKPINMNSFVGNSNNIFSAGALKLHSERVHTAPADMRWSVP